MIEPAYFPSLAAKDDSAERFARVVEQMRQEQRRGDDRANFALMALSRMPRFMGVSYRAYYNKPEQIAGTDLQPVVRGQWVLEAGSYE
jgi:hypothetical protein